VRNLFLADEGPQKPAKEVRPLIRMIGLVDADLLVLQEIGSKTTLSKLNERLDRPYPYIGLCAGNSRRSIHLGVLSRLPIKLTSHAKRVLTSENNEPLYWYASEEDMRSATLSPLLLQRDVLQVSVTRAGGELLTIFAVHLKSKTNPAWQPFAAEEIRAAEVRCLVDIVLGYQQSKLPLVVVGDFNDTAKSEVLKILDQLKLYDPMEEQLKIQGKNPSTYWPKRRSRIDRIMVGEKEGPQVVPQSPTIHIGHMARTASDHYPVSLSIV